MPRKHLWLGIPSVILDMLNMCWEGRAVNQPIIAWCPSVKAKGRKVHEKSNFCCNSPSVMCTSPLSLACVSVCSCQTHTFLCVCLEIQMLLYPTTLCTIFPPKCIHCKEQQHCTGVKLRWDSTVLTPVSASGLLATGSVSKPNQAMKLLSGFFSFKTWSVRKGIPIHLL